MEIDELKQAWESTKISNHFNQNIMELIHKKSLGPVTALKKVYRKQLIAMAIIPFILILANIQNINAVLTSVLFWCYVAFCIVVILFAGYNYRVTVKMSSMDNNLKDNLASQILLLKKRADWKIAGLRVALLVFIILAEVVPYFQQYRLLNYWHSMPIMVRLCVYAALMLLQFSMNKNIRKRNIDAPLDRLKLLLSELQ